MLCIMACKAAPPFFLILNPTPCHMAVDREVKTQLSQGSCGQLAKSDNDNNRMMKGGAKLRKIKAIRKESVRLTPPDEKLFSRSHIEVVAAYPFISLISSHLLTFHGRRHVSHTQMHTHATLLTLITVSHFGIQPALEGFEVRCDPPPGIAPSVGDVLALTRANVVIMVLVKFALWFCVRVFVIVCRHCHVQPFSHFDLFGSL